jgi:hypothetical protein
MVRENQGFTGTNVECAMIPIAKPNIGREKIEAIARYFLGSYKVKVPLNADSDF